MKIRDARAAADPPPDEVEFAGEVDEVDEAEPVAEAADENADENADEDEDTVDDLVEDQPDEPDQPDEVDEVDGLIDEDVEEEVPEEPNLFDEDAVVFDDDEDTLPRDVQAPEEAALHEVDQDQLLASAADWRDRWDQVQLGFVDQPLDAVESAGRMVGEVLDEMARTFAARRREIEARWSEASQISTDDLREVFLRYREFFNRVIV